MCHIMLMYVYISVADAVESSKFLSLLIFGDSMIDPGNNNYLLTIFKDSYFPL